MAFLEELCNGLQLGLSYDFVLSSDLRVWGYQQCQPPLSMTVNLSCFPSSVGSFISSIRYLVHNFCFRKDCVQLYNLINNLFLAFRQYVGDSPLAILIGFATQIDGGIYPPSAFVQLKIALLLSIVSLVYIFKSYNR